jgi:hypothetical protein
VDAPVLLVIFLLCGGVLAASVCVAYLTRHDSTSGRDVDAGKARTAREGWQQEEARRRADADRRARVEEAKRREQRAAEEDARLNEARKTFQAWEYVCKAHALTCTRCGELAYPIPITTDRYACPACRHQFVGAPHSVPLPPPNPDA